MNRQKSLYLNLLLFISCRLGAAPLIQKVVNNSNFGFMVVLHSDLSTCTFHDKKMIIDAQSTFEHQFLLELGKPSLVLRPVYFLEKKSGVKVWLVDAENKYNQESIKKAHELFRRENKSKKFKHEVDWLHNFVGLDIALIPHEVEIFGYLVNLSRVMMRNNIKQHVQWLSFAKGIFSKLVIELDINQHRSRGVFAKVKVLHGQGGVCSNGIIERI